MTTCPLNYWEYFHLDITNLYTSIQGDHTVDNGPSPPGEQEAKTGHGQACSLPSLSGNHGNTSRSIFRTCTSQLHCSGRNEDQRRDQRLCSWMQHRRKKRNFNTLPLCERNEPSGWPYRDWRTLAEREEPGQPHKNLALHLGTEPYFLRFQSIALL